TGPDTGGTGPAEASNTGPPQAGGTTAGPGWTWTMPSGLTYQDTPNPPLDP
ncbi:MAG: hypothetical protein QG671_16, partial [Actinomycetota bacterium]|nr:hypothetical protein [Actinomycetota bacterium]